jgi:hypothetical protein
MTLRKSRRFAWIPPAVTRPSRLPRGLVSLAAVVVASCQPAGVIDPKGPIAAAEWLLTINATEIMLVVVVPVILATLGVAWWFRSSNRRASRDPHFAYEGGIEFVTWSIPALIVILARLSPPTPSRCRSMSSRSIGNGCSFTPTSASPRSTSWSSPPTPR